MLTLFVITSSEAKGIPTLPPTQLEKTTNLDCAGEIQIINRFPERIAVHINGVFAGYMESSKSRVFIVPDGFHRITTTRQNGSACKWDVSMPCNGNLVCAAK